MTVEIKNLANTPIAEITRCFNESFSDYFIKIQATENYLKNRWTMGRVRYDLSFGCFVDEQLRGIIIHGVDMRNGILTAHNCATGIEPSFRGKGLLSNIYQTALQHLKDQRITQTTLEVIAKNKRAIRAYEKNGFKVDPVLLHCFSGQPALTVKKNVNVAIKISNSPDYSFYEKCRDFNPSWEMNKSAIEITKDKLEFYHVFLEEKKIGYLIFAPYTSTILQFAIHPGHRNKGYGKMLIDSLAKKHKNIRVNNVPETSVETVSFLKKIGMVNHVDQYEMYRDIN